MAIHSRPLLARLDDHTWAYTVPDGTNSTFEEIRIQVPPQHKGKEAYTVAQSAAALLQTKIARLRTSVLQTGLTLSIDTNDSSLAGAWRIGIPKPSSILQRAVATITEYVTEAIPFTRSLKDRKIVAVTVEKEPVAKKVASVALPILGPQPLHAIGGTLADVLAVSIADRISAESFQDPFTRLATECFQKYETFFVMEAQHRGTYRFVCDAEGKIHLENNLPSNAEAAEENRRTVAIYRNFLTREYGQAFVSQLETSYKISFDAMIKDGLPLLPDHVSKCNIGVNSIEIGHIERVATNLRALLAALRQQPDRTPQSAQQVLAQAVQDGLLSIREARGFLRSIPVQNPTLDDVVQHLTTTIGATAGSVRSFHPRTFNAVVSMVMPTDAELERSFAGRKIRHLAIMGAHTMGDGNTHNPCRDLFELLHVFAECRKTKEWKHYYELLSHVVVKKSLFRQTAGSENAWHVGLLIPAPDSETGERRWYSNDAFYDDHNGNVNYVLLPACHGYREPSGKSLPMIKMYRSTCMSSNAVNWQDSVAADLNPWGGPSSIDPERSFAIERRYIDERTIPVWMGYLLAAKQLSRTTARDGIQYRDLLIKATETFLEYTHQRNVHDEKLQQRLLQLAFNDEREQLERLLTCCGHLFEEDPADKIAQDIAFVGHSLGGALAQYGTWQFLAKERRIPLPGTDVTCYSSDGPAVTAAVDADFTAFGRQHGNLLKTLNIQMHVIHQFEYGDFVPQAGETHLGTTQSDAEKDSTWLDVSAAVFRPIDTTRVSSLVTLPTHGRRIGSATEGVDYTLSPLTPKDLWDYHRTFLLRGRLQRIFGNKVLRMPKASERVRSSIGFGLRPLMKLYQWWIGNQLGSRNSAGVFTIDDGHVMKKSRAIMRKARQFLPLQCHTHIALAL